MHPCLGLYRQAVRGILRLLWGRSVWRSVFCGHPCRVLLSWRAPWEVCMLHALQTPLAPPPTQYMFDRTVVHLEIFSFFPTCLDYVQSWKCFTALSSFQTRLWESYASLLWRKFPSERKNAIHGHFGMTHLLKWVFLELSSSKSFPDWSVSQWFAFFTIATVCHRYLFFVGLFSWKTGRLFLLLREAEWTILSHFIFIFLQELANRRDAKNHTLDHDYNFLFCSWSTEDGPLVQMDFLACCSFCGLVSFNQDSWSSPLPFPFFTGSSSNEHVPELTIFAFFFSPFRRVCCCCLVSWALFLATATCSAVAPRRYHSPQSLISASLSALISEQCLADKMSKRSSWVWPLSLASRTSSRQHLHPHHYPWLLMFLPRLGWTSWGCRCTTRQSANHSSSSRAPEFCWCSRIFYTWLACLKALDISSCCWVSSEKLIFLLELAGFIFMIPLAIFESRVSSSIWFLSNTNPEWSNSPMLNHRGWVDPRRKETFQELNFDACGQGSNSNVSASFLFWRTFNGHWSRVRQCEATLLSA